MKARLRHLCVAAAICAATAAQATDFSALARLDAAASSVVAHEQRAEVVLALSRPVPWRVRALDAPPRLVVEFRTVSFDGVDLAALTGPVVTGARGGALGDGWSRLVLDLAVPQVLAEAAMDTSALDGSARIAIRLEPAGADVVRRAAPIAVPAPAVLPPVARGDERPLVMLDPGHGGIDPGAVRDGHHEADLTLAFARVLRDALRREGRFRVALTREADVFVSLDGRIAAARRAGADVFVSIHADAVAEGIARGAQVYTLSEAASSTATAQLAERHNRADLLAGVDLSAHDDRIARVLMEIARTETAPRTEALADTLVGALDAGDIRLHARPRESAAFAVLRAPDIPSVLVEIGFMSTPSELEKLLSPEWRGRMAEALAAGLGAWAEADAARAALLRR